MTDILNLVKRKLFLMERVISYIDGFNLYFGLMDEGLRKYLWLNIQELSKRLLKPHQQLVQTKYFTARVSNPSDKCKRQSTYIEALQTLPNLRIFYGKYQINKQFCSKCKCYNYIPSEKKTDVNISTEMLIDAFQDQYDTALLISADSDLISPITAINGLFPQKRVVVAFPPKRSSRELTRAANCFPIGNDKIRQSQLPPKITTANKYVLTKPAEWR